MHMGQRVCRFVAILSTCVGLGGAAHADPARCEAGALDVAGAVAANIVYAPAKVLFAGTGAVLSLFASPMRDVSSSIYTTSVRGDYLMTPEQIACDDGPQFFGEDADELAEDDERAGDGGAEGEAGEGRAGPEADGVAVEGAGDLAGAGASPSSDPAATPAR